MRDSQDFVIHKDLRDFGRICETLGEDLQGIWEDLQGFVRLWGRIHKDSLQTLGEICKVCETLGEDLQGFVRLWESDLQGFTRLWKRIHKDLLDFGRGFARICETLGGFCKDL